LELIQEPFKQAGAKTRRLKHGVGGDFDLGQVPVMLQEFGAGGIFALIEFEKDVHPVVDSIEQSPSLE